MKVCVYGAGAIGGYLASALSAGGAEVSVVARGQHLSAIRERGLRVRLSGSERTVRLAASDRPEDFGAQDCVVLAMKATAVAPILDRLPALFHDNTCVLGAINGIPWWYFHEFGGAYEGKHLASVDPGGRQWSVIGPNRAVGCVVYPAAEMVEPGLINVISGDRFVIGEPSGQPSQRTAMLAEIMRKGGLTAPIRPRIREEIWVKLWGNLSFNPISVLTGATLAGICRNNGTRALARFMMLEAELVAGALGVTMPIGVEKRIAGAEALGEHKTSMLQDFERGRPMEIEALAGSVAELGRLTAVPTPLLDAVLALARLKAQTAGLELLPALAP